MINQATILGRVGKKSTHAFNNGTEVTNLSVATSNKYVKDGEKKEKTMWHNIVLFSKLAGIAKQYVNEGDLIYVQGEMDSQKYTGKDGQERIKFVVIGHVIKLVPRSSPAAKPSTGNVDPAFVDDELPF